MSHPRIILLSALASIQILSSSAYAQQRTGLDLPFGTNPSAGAIPNLGNPNQGNQGIAPGGTGARPIINQAQTPSPNAPMTPGSAIPGTPFQIPLPAFPGSGNQPSPGSFSQAESGNGDMFDNLDPNLDMKMVQKKWSVGTPKPGDGQVRAGIKTISAADCLTTVKVRLGIETTLLLPKGVEAKSARVGSAAFVVRSGANAGSDLAPNEITVKARAFGVDSNLTITTKEGDLLPLRVQSYKIDAEDITDFTVNLPPKMMDACNNPSDAFSSLLEPTVPRPSALAPGTNSLVPATENRDATGQPTVIPAPKPRYSEIQGEYIVYAGSPDDAEIAPLAAWFDSISFTLEWGQRARNGKIPTVSVLRADGVETVVQPRREGTRQTYEIRGDLVLTLGDKRLCLREAPYETKP
jgi:hypothetical protein